MANHITLIRLAKAFCRVGGWTEISGITAPVVLDNAHLAPPMEVP